MWGHLSQTLPAQHANDFCFRLVCTQGLNFIQGATPYYRFHLCLPNARVPILDRQGPSKHSMDVLHAFSGAQDFPTSPWTELFIPCSSNALHRFARFVLDDDPYFEFERDCLSTVHLEHFVTRKAL
jgi:hypothetical protein